MSTVSPAEVRIQAGVPRLLQTRLRRNADGEWTPKRDLPESCKRVFDAIASEVNNKGVCRLSLAEIAARTGLHANTVRRATRRLERCKLLLIESKGAGPGHKLQYCLRFFYRVFLKLRNALRKLFSDFSTDKGTTAPIRYTGDKFKTPEDARAGSSPPRSPSALMGRMRRALTGNASLSKSDRQTVLSCVGLLVKRGHFSAIAANWDRLHALLELRSGSVQLPDWRGSRRCRWRALHDHILATIAPQRASGALDALNGRAFALVRWANSIVDWTPKRCEWYATRRSELVGALESMDLTQDDYASLFARDHWRKLCPA